MLKVDWRSAALTVLLGCAAVLMTPFAERASAADLPFSGPIRIYAGFAAGGQSDLLARIVAERLKDHLGRPIIIENKTGAGGRVAVELVKNLPADGSALVAANNAQMTVAPSLFADLPYDPVKDFTPLTRAVDFQIALATGSLTQAKDMPALVTWLGAHREKRTSGNPGTGSLPHLYGFAFGQALGIDLVPVPYRGGVPIITALTQGEIAMGWAGVADFIEPQRNGQLKIVAVTGSRRSPQLPDVPTFADLGYGGVGANGWIGLFAPANMLTDLATRFERALQDTLQDATTRDKLEALGFLVVASGQRQLADDVARDLSKWRELIAAKGIKP